MKVLIFGATGMVGQAALRACLLDPDVELVETMGRKATGRVHPKLSEVVNPDLWHYSDYESDMSGFDACFFCLGVSSGGMSESDYYRVTYGIATAAGKTLARLNPEMTFLYVSGAGTDSSEEGGSMWARVKGKTENALLEMPFRAAYMLRPAGIQPVNGERSRTSAYRILYDITGPILPLLRRIFPNHILTTDEIGRAMLNIAKRGAPKSVLESKDILWAAQSVI